MNISQILRIIFDNIKLMLAVGFLMALVIFIVIKNDPDVYTSSSTVYTGFATGFNIETGAETRLDIASTNASFDNLIYVIRSRETHKETALKLLAQHLMLDGPDPRIISSKYYNESMKDIPQEVKDLVVKSLSAEWKATPTSNQTEVGNEQIVDEQNLNQTKKELRTRKVQKFRDKNVTHQVRSGEPLGDIAKKYGTTIAQLQAWNDLDPYYGGMIIVVKKEKVPYEEEIQEWVDIPVTRDDAKVDAGDIFDTVNEGFEETYQAVLPELELERLAFEQTYKKLKEYSEQDHSNYIHKLLQSDNPFYSLKKISSVKANRESNSDMIVLRFDSNDPGVCMQTLKILIDVFTNEYTSITAKETRSVSDFFEKKTAEAFAELTRIEKELLEFSKANKIINYGEQTKFIAEQKEISERERFEVLARLSKSKAHLQVLDKEMASKGPLYEQSKKVTAKRGELSDILANLSTLEGSGGGAPGEIESLRRARSIAENSLNNEIRVLHSFGRSTQGMPMSTLLQNWLTQTSIVAETQAEYNNIVAKRKGYFDDIYAEMSPKGSMLSSMERKQSTAEQTYLEYLHKLNLANLKQLNIESSNIQMWDSPFFPLEPNGSKAKLFVLIGFMAGFFITGAIIFLLEFIDTSMRNPEGAVTATGLKLFGGFPQIENNKRTRVDYSFVTNRLIEIMVQKIRMEVLAKNKTPGDPFLINLISTRAGEGKSYVGKKIAAKLQMGESRVLYLKPYETDEEESFDDDFTNDGDSSSEFVFEYDVPPNFLNIIDVSELIYNFTFPPESFDYIILELPALLRNEFPVGLANSADMTILTCKASRNWNSADEEVLNLYLDSCRNKPVVLINGSRVNDLESILGEIPKLKSPQGGAEPLFSFNIKSRLFKNKTKPTGIL